MPRLLYPLYRESPCGGDWRNVRSAYRTQTGTFHEFFDDDAVIFVFELMNLAASRPAELLDLHSWYPQSIAYVRKRPPFLRRGLPTCTNYSFLSFTFDVQYSAIAAIKLSTRSPHAFICTHASVIRQEASLRGHAKVRRLYKPIAYLKPSYVKLWWRTTTDGRPRLLLIRHVQ